MSENIKVSEVSDILRKQLEGINANVQLDEIGTVLQVSDGVVRIYGLRNAEANELLEFDNGIKAIVMNLEAVSYTHLHKSWYLEYPVSDDQVRKTDYFLSLAETIFRKMKPFNDFLNRALSKFEMPQR